MPSISSSSRCAISKVSIRRPLANSEMIMNSGLILSAFWLSSHTLFPSRTTSGVGLGVGVGVGVGVGLGVGVSVSSGPGVGVGVGVGVAVSTTGGFGGSGEFAGGGVSTTLGQSTFTASPSLTVMLALHPSWLMAPEEMTSPR